MLTRRGFVGLGLVAAAVRFRALARADGFPRYRGAMVIDALGGPGDPDDTVEGGPFTARAVTDARASGITACNVTVAVGGDPWDEVIRNIAWWERELDLHADAFIQVRHAAHLREANAKGKMGIIFGAQGLSMIGEDLQRLETLQRLGLRIAQLTYNVRAVTGDGCLEPGNAGLSRFGHQVIERVEALRMVVDLSHGGRRTIAEAIAAARQPFITHTGCAAVNEHPRNVPDEILRAVAQKGGVVGIYFMPFLRPAGQPHAEDVVRHLEHAVNVAGEDHVGVGTDGGVSGITINDTYKKAHAAFVARRKKLGIAAPGEAEDVYNFVPELNGPRKMEALAELLARRGFGEARVLKILGGNFARAFGEVWG